MQQTFIDLRAGDIDDSIHWALSETGRFLGADRAYLLRYDFDAKTESMTHEWNADRTEPELPTYQEVRFDLNPAGIDMSLKGEIIAVRDLNDAPEQFAGDVPFLIGSGLVSLLEFPIVIGGVTVGSLGFDWTDDSATWTDDDLPVLNLFAATFAQLLARQAAEEERERLLQQLIDVFERSPAALALIDDHGVLLQVNDELCRMVGHEASELVGQFAGVLLRPEHLERCIEWGTGFVTGDATRTPQHRGRGGDRSRPGAVGRHQATGRPRRRRRAAPDRAADPGRDRTTPRGGGAGHVRRAARHDPRAPARSRPPHRDGPRPPLHERDRPRSSSRVSAPLSTAIAMPRSGGR